MLSRYIVLYRVFSRFENYRVRMEEALYFDANRLGPIESEDERNRRRTRGSATMRDRLMVENCPQGPSTIALPPSPLRFSRSLVLWRTLRPWRV